MAEPPKPKRPSRSKKAPEPDFSAFEDWLIDGPAGEWPEIWDNKKKLTDRQKQIVVRNAMYLLNRDAWNTKVKEFEAALASIPNEASQKRARSKFHIRFDEHEFEDGGKDFSGMSFPCGVSFTGATFGNGYVWFDGAAFREGNNSFCRVTSGVGTVSFSNTTFDRGGVLFIEAKFGPGDLYFDGTVFGNGTVSFAGASFGKGNVWFSGTTFGEGSTIFNGAMFSDCKVSFFGASFGEGEVSFDGTKFRSTAVRASGMVVAGNLTINSHFPEAVDFSRLDVKGTANFSGSSFDTVPDFTNAKFDRSPEVAGMVVPRPTLKRWSSLAADREDVAKFRKLKAMALAANDHEKDGEFFAGEMLAKRGTETKGFLGLLFNTIYWWLSDFGQSFVRPLVWLGVSFVSFAGACLYLIRGALTLTDRLWFAADFSFRNMLPLFGSLFRFAPAPKDHVSWYQNTYDRLATAGVDIDRLISLGIVQGLIGTVLLFLFLLALRNKFRLK